MKLSIIIPCYNDYEHMSHLAGQIVPQLVDGTELIIVDDGSTDGLQLDLSPMVYHLNKNLGVSAARNVGVGLAKGEYVTFVDSDDEVKGIFVKSILEAIRSKKSLYWFTAKTDDNCLGYHKDPVWAKVYKRSLIKDLPFNEKLNVGEDIIWSEKVRILAGDDYEKINKTIYHNHWLANPNSLSKRYNRGELPHDKS